MRASRVLGRLTVAVLAGITGVVSWLHALAVVREVGNTGLVAYLVPFVPDLMIVTSSITLLEAARTGLRRPWMAMVSLATGAGVTVVLNVAAGWRQGTGSCLLNGLIPVAFVLTFETLIGLLRTGRSVAAGRPGGAGCDHVPPLSLDEAIAAAYPVMRSQRQTALAFGVSKSKVAAVTGTAGVNGSGPHE